MSFTTPHGGQISGYGLTQLTGLDWTDSRNCYVEDDYSVPTTLDINDKWERVHMSLDRANRATDCLEPSLPNGDKLYLSCANGASPGAFPATVA